MTLSLTRRTLIARLGLAVPAAVAICMPDLGSAALAVNAALPGQPATVDPEAAAAIISAYRKSRGLPAVTVDARLNEIAAGHSRTMAKAGRMAHNFFGGKSFARRLSAGGYDAAIAVENLAAGPQTLDQAMNAWRRSRGHNANLLKPGVTQMGIAVAYAPKNKKFRDFWTLVLAAPDDGPPPAGPDAGPAVSTGGKKAG